MMDEVDVLLKCVEEEWAKHEAGEALRERRWAEAHLAASAEAVRERLCAKYGNGEGGCALNPACCGFGWAYPKPADRWEAVEAARLLGIKEYDVIAGDCGDWRIVEGGV